MIQFDSHLRAAEEIVSTPIPTCELVLPLFGSIDPGNSIESNHTNISQSYVDCSSVLLSSRKHGCQISSPTPDGGLSIRLVSAVDVAVVFIPSLPRTVPGSGFFDPQTVRITISQVNGQGRVPAPPFVVGFPGRPAHKLPLSFGLLSSFPRFPWSFFQLRDARLHCLQSKSTRNSSTFLTLVLFYLG